MSKTSIEWTDVTWNPVTGCTWASPGCDNCYAATTRRLEAMGLEKYSGLTTPRHFNGVLKTHLDSLSIPLRWKKPRRIFVNSMSDLFHKDVRFEFIDEVFAVMATARRHTFQLLTKRPDRMAEYTHRVADDPELIGAAAGTLLDGDWIHGPGKPYRKSIESCINHYHGFSDNEECYGHETVDPIWPLPNVWLGTSVEDQLRADERIPHLLRCPAAVRFLSLEPLLGPVDLMDIPDGGSFLDSLSSNLSRLDWVIVGGESGPGARPYNTAWPLRIIRQCEAAGVPCFHKQLGARP